MRTAPHHGGNRAGTTRSRARQLRLRQTRRDPCQLDDRWSLPTFTIASQRYAATWLALAAHLAFETGLPVSHRTRRNHR